MSSNYTIIQWYVMMMASMLIVVMSIVLLQTTNQLGLRAEYVTMNGSTHICLYGTCEPQPDDLSDVYIETKDDTYRCVRWDEELYYRCREES